MPWSEALHQCAAAVHVVGLDINAVIGIAFAAFTIGILLTAALWFIHSRTGNVDSFARCCYLLLLLSRHLKAQICHSRMRQMCHTDIATEKIVFLSPTLSLFKHTVLDNNIFN